MSGPWSRKQQAGSRAAFEELVRRHDRDVLRLALNLMKRPEGRPGRPTRKRSSRFTAISTVSRFECSFYTWLYRIVTNVCLDHLRPPPGNVPKTSLRN